MEWISIIGALYSILAGLLVSGVASSKIIQRILGKKAPPKTYSERLSELTSSLKIATSQVDSILQELSLVALEKEGTVKKLETGLGVLDK